MVVDSAGGVGGGGASASASVKKEWDAGRVRALRSHLRLTQMQLAKEMGTKQAIVSWWERGRYKPRGMAVRLLGLLAERSGFEEEK